MKNYLGIVRPCLAITCALLVFAAWILASPIGSSPDDNFHLPSIWCGRGDVKDQCSLTADATSVLVPKPIQRAITCYAFNVAQSAACQSVTPDWTKRKFTEAPWNNPKAHLYPPGFYFVMSFFVVQDARVSALLMRAINVVLAILLIGGLMSLAVGSEIQGAALLVPLIMSVPLGLFIIASNNPSSWTIIGVSSYWGYLYLLGREQGRGRAAVLWSGAFLAALLAIFSRVDGSIYTLVATGVTLLALSRSTKDLYSILRRPWVLSLILPVSMLAVYSFLHLGQGMKVAQAGLQQEGIPVRTLDQLIFNNLIFLPSLWNGAVGSWGLGWLDTAMSPTVPLAVFSVAFYLVVAGLQGARTARLCAFWLVVAALTAIPLYVLTRAGQFVGETVQPRYILPLMYLAMGIALIREKAGQRLSFSLKTSYVFMILVSLAHSIALHQNIRRYVTGTDVVDIDLNRDIEWWWDVGPSPAAVWLVGSLAFTLLSLMLAYKANRAGAITTAPQDASTQTA